MTRLSPASQKLALTLHVACSVGWLGALLSFLVLAVAGLWGGDADRVRSAYLAMDATSWVLLVPLSLLSLSSGVVQSLGSKWGLFQHYWVLFKLLINLVGSLGLLVHTRLISAVAQLAASRSLSAADLHDARLKLVSAAAGAVLLLLVATVLSVYKPRGRTRYGWRMLRATHGQEQDGRRRGAAPSSP